MSSDALLPIREALKAGDKRRARDLLRPLIAEKPTAELWYLSAHACESRDHARTCLNRALAYDRNHQPTKRALNKIESGLDMPPLDAPLEIPRVDPDAPPIPLPAKKAAAAPKSKGPKRTGANWTLIGCGGSILLSLSSLYLLLSITGSPIAEQVRSLLSGEGLAPAVEGTPVFGNSSGTGTGTFVVQPDKSMELKRQQPTSDVLDSGHAHEYVFEASTGEEVAIGIQFFSPSAKQVGANVAVLDPDGNNAKGVCERQAILMDGSSATFICQINKSGAWKLQILGRTDQSTGVYAVTFERMD
ncbi:MAG TPA: hypothetical protein VHO69_02690 [Phototrophicaceae bacterium]|nr:hypothetical protein [Phototrophicaceae bacterium]